MSGTRLVLSKRYSIEELYERLKDADLAAGRAFLITQGPTRWIVFPPMDRQNQVVIGGSNGVFYVQRNAQPLAFFTVPNGNSQHSFSEFFLRLSGCGDRAKKCCEQTAKAVGRQINGMDL